MEKKDSISNIQIETNLPYNKSKRKKTLTDAQLSVKNNVLPSVYENIKQ